MSSRAHDFLAGTASCHDRIANHAHHWPDGVGWGVNGKLRAVTAVIKDPAPTEFGIRIGTRAEPMRARILYGTLITVIGLSTLPRAANATDRPMIEAVVDHDSGA